MANKRKGFTISKELEKAQAIAVLLKVCFAVYWSSLAGLVKLQTKRHNTSNSRKEKLIGSLYPGEGGLKMEGIFFRLWVDRPISGGYGVVVGGEGW